MISAELLHRTMQDLMSPEYAEWAMRSRIRAAFPRASGHPAFAVGAQPTEGVLDRLLTDYYRRGSWT